MVVSDSFELLKNALAGRYQVERELGSGGMARVYLAQDLKHNRRVAIKTLKPEVASAVGATRFLREIEIAAGLNHPNILPLHDSGETDGQPYFVMPYVEGESLGHRIDREGALPVDEAVRITKQIAAALDFAHQQGVIHRDIKPDNVLLVAGQAVVADFGIARAVDAARKGQITETGRAIGTPAYMSPEQAKGRADVDVRTDVYALGGVLYEMLTGKAPYSGPNPQAVLAQMLTEPVPPVRQTRPDVPPHIERTVARAMAKDRNRRFPTPAALAEALDTTGVRSISFDGLVPRRTSTRSVIAAVVIGVMTVAVWSLTSTRGPAATDADVQIAVLPFTVRGSPDLAYLGEGMVDLLSTTLDGAGSWRSVDPRNVLSVMIDEGSETLTPAAGQRIAEELGAGLYVLGNIVTAGSQLRVDASLYRADGTGSATHASVEGGPDDVFRLVDQLAGELLAGQAGVQETRFTQIALVTTSSLPALKAYLRGLRDFRGQRYVEATEAFMEAVAADSGFALAWYQLSVTADWMLRADLALEASAKAVQFADRLSERDRRLVEALETVRQGDAEEAERRYRAIVGMYPDDVEAWTQLGEVLFHFSPRMGNPFGEAREPLERLAELQPEQTGAQLHLARVSASSGDFARLDAETQHILDHSPGGDRELETLAIRAFTIGDAADRAEVLRRAAGTRDEALAEIVWSLGAFVDLAAAEAIANVMSGSSRSLDSRLMGHINRAQIFAARGRWNDAQGELALAQRLNPAIGLEYQAMLSLAPFLPVPESRIAALRNRVMALDAEAAQPSATPSIFFAVHNDVHPHFRLYLLGLLDARLGGYSAAAEYAEELATLTGPPGSGSVIPDLATGIHAAIAVARGDSAEALELLESTRLHTWHQMSSSSSFFSETHQRFLRAKLLKDAGSDAEALRWLGTFTETSLMDMPYAAVASLWMGEIHERGGEAALARDRYQFFIDLWAEADEELQPLVEDARRRVARLR